MTILENDALRVTIKPEGAELTSLFQKSSNVEHLWQADPTVWPWHAPNLFPVVGGCLNNELLIGGETYSMQRHGFARRSFFETTESSNTHAVFSLRADSETRTVYPYKFLFQIMYELDGPRLTITYRMLNEDEQPVYFSVGAHPAFAIPFQKGDVYEDYFIEFEYDERLITHKLSESGYFTGETEPVTTTGNRLSITKHLFDQDALVFKNLRSRRVTLRSNKQEHTLTVEFPNFPYLGLWAKPGASFVCIEPWLGCADSEGHPVPIEQKELIRYVDVEKVFEASFSIIAS